MPKALEANHRDVTTALNASQRDLRQAQLDLNRLTAEIEVMRLQQQQQQPPEATTPSPNAFSALAEGHIAILTAVFSHEALKEICKRAAVGSDLPDGAVALPSSGTKTEMATRIVHRASLLRAGSPEDYPSRQQLSYIAAACRRQGLFPGVMVVTNKLRAMRWLSDHADYGQ